MGMTAFEDFQPSEIRAYGDYRFTEAEIVEFASVYDAQPFHLDDAAGRRSMLGGLSASGWHTCSALMRMMVDGWLAETTCLAGIGVEDNRWLAPVRPGDRLTARTETLEKIDLRSRPDAGIVKFATSLRNQDGVEVLAQKTSTLFARREKLAVAALPLRQKKAALEKKTAENPPEPIADRFGALPDHFARAQVGAFAQLGETLFTADFIRDYAEKYDPMPFHIDEAAGKAHFLGAMSAAGFQTASCWMGHFIALRREAAAGGETPSRASPGFSGLVWRKPVLLGDRIAFSSHVIAKRATSKPNLGLVRSRNLGVNQRGEIVIEFDASVFTPIEE